MNIVIAVDKFKHSLNSFQAGEALCNGLLKANTLFDIHVLPMSDGGDGLSDVMSSYGSYTKINCIVSDPLFRKVGATYLLSDDGKTAIIEMAQASGLQLLKTNEYDPLHTTSFGTGELIRSALDKGVRKIILGIGGSATNDGGIGIASALGYRFLDKDGNELNPTGSQLICIHKIDASGVSIPEEVQVEIACDVDNLLTGPEGAAFIFGPQKGATAETVRILDEGLDNFSQVIKRDLGTDVFNLKGGGAAGGAGAGCYAFLHASLISGIELVLKYSEGEKYIAACDIVITGEGKLDEQTFKGKLVQGIIRLASIYSKPVIAISGSIELTSAQCKNLGLAAAFSIINKPLSTDEALSKAYELTMNAGYHIGCLLDLNKTKGQR